MDRLGKKHFNKIICQIVLPYSIRVPEEHFQFPDKDIKADLFFRRYARSNPKDQFQLDAERQIIEKERFGRYDYSIVDVILEKHEFYYSQALDLFNIRVLALGIVRKFIQFYKLTYDEYWIIEPSINDILSFTVKCYQDEKELPGIVGEFINTPDSNRIVGISTYLAEKKAHRSEMITKLSANFDVPLYTQLMMQGNRLYFEESYDVAVVLFDRSFESFFDILVKIYLQKNNMFDQRWSKYTRMNLVGRKRKDSKLASYSSLVSKSGSAFQSPDKEYERWYKDCRAVRNDIIHGRLNNIGNEKAGKALTASRRAFEFFGWIWYDLILVDQKYYDSSNNEYHIQL